MAVDGVGEDPLDPLVFGKGKVRALVEDESARHFMARGVAADVVILVVHDIALACGGEPVAGAEPGKPRADDDDCRFGHVRTPLGVNRVSAECCQFIC